MRFFDRLLKRRDQDADSNRPDEDHGRRPLRLNLGIDFGTSFTKVCYRDLGSDHSGIIDFSTSDSSDWVNALIDSRIVRSPNGTIRAGAPGRVEPNASETIVDTVKMRLALLDLAEELKAFSFSELGEEGSSDRVESLACIFLANVLVNAKRWLQENREELFVGRTVTWSASVGVPVQVLDSPALKRFKKVFGWAWILAEDISKPIIDIDEADRMLERVRLSNRRAQVDIHAYPEIAAAVLSFVSSPSARDGMYVYFDIGGGTLDGVTFRLRREDGLKAIDFYAGEIQPEGVESIANELPNKSREELLDALTAGRVGDFPDVLGSHRDRIHQHVARVLMTTKKKNRNEWSEAFANSNWHAALKIGIRRSNEPRLPIFLGGGGSRMKYFERSILGTYEAHQLENTNTPKMEIFQVPPPLDLDLGHVPPDEFHRFAIAYGLSFDFGEAPDVALPRQFEEQTRPEVVEPPVAGHYED